MARQFIYHMAGLNKAYGTKKVLENIHLSFYPDAKIGILGPNGAGKSTVLKIMAGMDKEYTGEAWLAEGATVGYLAQEPALDPAKTVFENIMEGVAAKTAIIDRYNELMMNYSDETADESAQAAGRHGSPQPVGSGAAGRDGDGSVGLPAERRRGDQAFRRRAPPGGAVPAAAARSPTSCCSTSRPTISTPRPRRGSKSICAQYPGAVMIITHDRYFLDNVTGWILELDRGRGIPYEGNYTAYLEAKAKRMLQEGREDDARAKGARPRARVDRVEPEGAAGQIQGAHQGL